MIATYSPRQILEVGLLSYHSEKTPRENGRVRIVVLFSPVRLVRELSRIRHVSRISRE
jgi:hypothetical protein